VTGWLDIPLILIVLTNLVLLGTGRLSTCIRTGAAQGVLLGLLPLLALSGGVTLHAVLLALMIVLIKGVAFPLILLRTMRDIQVRREVQPLVGYTPSLLIGIACLFVSLSVSARLPLPVAVASPLALPVALSTIFTGFFVIITRKQAITQVIGYLAAENGIYAFGASLTHGGSLLVELAILLDVLVAVFIMGIAIHHIKEEFDSIDMDHLSSLKE
jgi:hydrogenase-4 component E